MHRILRFAKIIRLLKRKMWKFSKSVERDSVNDFLGSVAKFKNHSDWMCAYIDEANVVKLA